MPVPRIVIEATLFRDPEIRYSTSGVAVGDIGLVASTSHKQGDEWVTDHELWVYAKAFGATAEALAEAAKGDRGVFTGRLVTESWEPKDGGEKQSRTRLLLDSFSLFPRRDGGGGGGRQRQSQVPTQRSSPQEDPWATAGGEAPPF